MRDGSELVPVTLYTASRVAGAIGPVVTAAQGTIVVVQGIDVFFYADDLTCLCAAWVGSSVANFASWAPGSALASQQTYRGGVAISDGDTIEIGTNGDTHYVDVTIWGLIGPNFFEPK